MAKAPKTQIEGEAPAKVKAQGPTKEQLAAIHSGGSYTFNPDTGEMKETRKPASPAKKEAK